MTGKRTTKEEVMGDYRTIIPAASCRMRFMLRFTAPKGYICDEYGCWRTDVYDLGDSIALISGPEAFGNTDIPYGIMKKYDDRCKKIAEDEDLSFEEARKRTNVILDSFILSIKNNRDLSPR